MLNAAVVVDSVPLDSYFKIRTSVGTSQAYWVGATNTSIGSGAGQSVHPCVNAAAGYSHFCADRLKMDEPLLMKAGDVIYFTHYTWSGDRTGSVTGCLQIQELIA